MGYMYYFDNWKVKRCSFLQVKRLSEEDGDDQLDKCTICLCEFEADEDVR